LFCFFAEIGPRALDELLDQGIVPADTYPPLRCSLLSVFGFRRAASATTRARHLPREAKHRDKDDARVICVNAYRDAAYVGCRRVHGKA
jgi:hypothetical protein